MNDEFELLPLNDFPASIDRQTEMTAIAFKGVAKGKNEVLACQAWLAGNDKRKSCSNRRRCEDKKTKR
jgi:hypothetical protein